MKKYLSIFVTMAMILTLVTGCGTTTTTNSTTESSIDATETTQTIKVVSTIFPEYDWVREIVGDVENVELTLLLNDGVDLHSYQATADDIITISNCDLFLYVGGESDGWVEDVLAIAENPNLQAINLVEVLGDAVKLEESVEGMQASAHSHDHDEEEEEHEHEEDEHTHEEDEHTHEEDEHTHEEDEHTHEEDEHTHDEDCQDDSCEVHGHSDEHVWLSLRNAQSLCAVIATTLGEIDPDNADTYLANANTYCEKLSTLDEQYTETVANATYNTILVGDRFPFRYLVDDYELDYYAAFSGCSAETEASFETISFLSTKLEELGLPVILTIDGSDQKIANTIKENTTSQDQTVLVLHSLQSISTSEVESGATYLSLMEGNLEVLKEALE